MQALRDEVSWADPVFLVGVEAKDLQFDTEIDLPTADEIGGVDLAVVEDPSVHTYSSTLADNNSVSMGVLYSCGHMFLLSSAAMIRLFSILRARASERSPVARG